MKLAQIASVLDARLENGSPDIEITGVAGIKDAGPGQLTFVANPKYAGAAKATRASAVIVTEEFPAVSAALLRCKNPYLAFAHALELFSQPPRYEPGVHPTAVVHASAKIGEGAHIGPYVVIDQGVEIGRDAVLLAHVVIYRDARIGDNFFAHAHAVVREGCQLGDRVLLQNGAVIGADGFGFAKDDSGHWYKILQPEPVVIEDDVEIQANSCIDRASVEKTRSDAARRSIIWCRSVTALASGSIRCWRHKWAWRAHRGRQRCDPYRTGGRCRPLQDRRWSDCDSAERGGRGR